VTTTPATSGAPTTCPAAGTCRHRFDDAAQVELKAVPEPGFAFVSWSGACSGSSPICTLSMNRAHTVSAEFGSAKQLTVAILGKGSGKIEFRVADRVELECPVIEGNVCQKTFLDDTEVTLVSSGTNDDSLFLGWGEDCASVGTGLNCVLRMTHARSATAEFKEDFVLVTWNINQRQPGFVGSIEIRVGTTLIDTCTGPRVCEHRFPPGTPITLTARDGVSCAQFVQWDGTIDPNQERTVSFVMDQPHQLVAWFHCP
jgi:hypothetical protein